MHDDQTIDIWGLDPTQICKSGYFYLCNSGSMRFGSPFVAIIAELAQTQLGSSLTPYFV